MNCNWKDNSSSIVYTEGQPLSFSLGTNAPAGMTLTNLDSAIRNPQSAILQWTPALTNIGTNRVEIIVRDPQGGEARQTFDLEVLPSAPNNPPQFTSTPRTQTRLGSLYAYVVSASDPTGDPLNFALFNGPGGMVLTNGSPSPQPSPPGEQVLQNC